jgi:hypothetical protein
MNRREFIAALRTGGMAARKKKRRFQPQIARSTVCLLGEGPGCLWAKASRREREQAAVLIWRRCSSSRKRQSLRGSRPLRPDYRPVDYECRIR